MYLFKHIGEMYVFVQTHGRDVYVCIGLYWFKHGRDVCIDSNTWERCISMYWFRDVCIGSNTWEKCIRM